MGALAPTAPGKSAPMQLTNQSSQFCSRAYKFLARNRAALYSVQETCTRKKTFTRNRDTRASLLYKLTYTRFLYAAQPVPGRCESNSTANAYVDAQYLSHSTSYILKSVERLILSFRNFGVMTLTCWGHVTSSGMWPLDSQCAVSYELTMYLARLLRYWASKIWGHDLDLSDSRDVISHVTVVRLICIFL